MGEDKAERASGGHGGGLDQERIHLWHFHVGCLYVDENSDGLLTLIDTMPCPDIRTDSPPAGMEGSTRL